MFSIFFFYSRLVSTGIVQDIAEQGRGGGDSADDELTADVIRPNRLANITIAGDEGRAPYINMKAESS